MLLILLVYSLGSQKNTSTVGSTDVEDLDVINELAFEEWSLHSNGTLLPSEALKLICTDLHMNVSSSTLSAL